MHHLPRALLRQHLWRQGETVNCPVKLKNCRHVFDLGCLAMFMFSPNSDECCPICRKEITDKSQLDHEEDPETLQYLARFMYIAQSQFSVGKAALWKVMQGAIFHEWGQGASAEVMERNEMLLYELANALCGGSEGFIDPANAMNAGEERHRAEAQRLTDSDSISTRLLKKQAVKI